jgi:YHS domain-containing protein
MKKSERSALAWVAAVIIVAGISAAIASDAQRLTAVVNDHEKLPIILVQRVPTKENANKTSKVYVDKKGIILEGYDPVAYLTQGKPVEGNPEIQSSYQGATYLFASEKAKAEFDKDPAKYAPQYGGYCAYALSTGRLSGSKDPEAFVVHNGKLYVFGGRTGLDKFRADLDRNIRKADKQWLRINEF